MGKVISIHEYVLRHGVTDEQFIQSVKAAKERGLFNLPGLDTYYFLRGIRGARTGAFAAVWVYRDKEAWEELWGPIDHPISSEDYPPAWKIWEDEILAPLLSCDPDDIRFTSYEEIKAGAK